jgi:hypothetical protein
LNGIDLKAHLRCVVERIAEHPINRVDGLRPWAVAEALKPELPLAALIHPAVVRPCSTYAYRGSSSCVCSASTILSDRPRWLSSTMLRSRSAAAADVKRGRLIMMLEEGVSWSAIASLRIRALQST